MWLRTATRMRCPARALAALHDPGANGAVLGGRNGIGIDDYPARGQGQSPDRNAGLREAYHGVMPGFAQGRAL